MWVWEDKTANKISLRILLLYIIPVCAIVFDIIVRFPDMRKWPRDAWGIYLISWIGSIGMWQIIIFSLYFLKRKSIWAGMVFLVIISSAMAFIYLASWRAFFYFKFMPNYYIISYIFTEPEHLWMILKEYLPPLFWGLILLSLALSILLWIDAKDYLKNLLARRWVIIGGIILWSSSILVLNNNLKIWDQSSLPDINFFIVAGQHHYYKYSNYLNPKEQGLISRNISELEQIDREPGFNVLIMLQESLRPDHLSIYGYKRDTTPNLREFSARHQGEFFLFEKAYAHSLATDRSVRTILQGLNPSISIKLAWQNSPVIFEYAKMLKKVSAFFITSQKANWQSFLFFIQSPALDYLWSRETSGLLPYNDTGVDDREMVKEFLRYIDQLSAYPGYFIGVVGFNANHNPYKTPEEYKKWQGQLVDQYDNSILFLDSILATALNHLEQKQLLNNTIIIFVSDHGEAFGEHNFFGRQRFYNEAIQIPFWIYIPKSLQDKIPGLDHLQKNTKKVIGLQDITPTILDLYKIYDLQSIEKYRSLMQGGSLLRNIDESRPIFSLNYTEISPTEKNLGLSLIINRKKYLITVLNNVAQEHLYDIYQDPKETINLWPSLTEPEKEFYHQILLSYPNTKTIYQEAVMSCQK